MKCLKINLQNEPVIDSYIYAGYLFCVFNDGSLNSIPLLKIYEYLEKYYSKQKSLLTIALLRNDWFDNTQSLNILKQKELYNILLDLWNDLSKEEINLEIDKNDWTHLFNIISMPIYDLKLYNFRIYLGGKDGLYEAILNIQDKKEIEVKSQLERVFDARSIFISAKSGNFAVSSGNDGLFYGSLWDNSEKLIIHERNNKKIKKSLRSGWICYDLLNYENNSKFNYIINEIEDIKNFRKFPYSSSDDDNRKVRIKEFDKKEIDIELNYDQSEILYMFNSGVSCYFVFKNGDIKRINLINSIENNMHFSSRTYDSSIKTIKDYFGKPYSAIPIKNGIAIEYFSKVVLIYNQNIQIIENQPIISMRTFLSSKRYKRIICLTKENSVSIVSLFPFYDKEISETSHLELIQ